MKKEFDYTKQFFNEHIQDILAEEIFTRRDSIEIINYLETFYQDSLFITENKINDINEKILLDFDNKLVNLYLIRYCKSVNTFFNLIKSNPSLVENGLFNRGLIHKVSNNLIPYLIEDISLLKTFFNYYMESSNTILIKEFIYKEKGFESISDKIYFEVLENIFRHRKLEVILKEESEPYSELSSDRITYGIWRLLEKLDVNENSITVLSSIGGFKNRLMSIPYNSNSTINELLEKWSNFEYNKVERDYEFDFVTSTTDMLDKVSIQMLIASYSRDNSHKSQYDGVRAYSYMHNHIEYFIKYDKKEFENFIVKNNRNIQNKDKMFDYFKYNIFNYTETFFEISYPRLDLDKMLILENFEKIGKSIIAMEWWQLEELLEFNNLEESTKQYYKTLYYLQTLQLDNSQINELIDKQNKVIEIVVNKKTTLW